MVFDMGPFLRDEAWVMFWAVKASPSKTCRFEQLFAHIAGENSEAFFFSPAWLRHEPHMLDVAHHMLRVPIYQPKRILKSWSGQAPWGQEHLAQTA